MTKLTTKTARENLPEEVAARVVDMAREYKTRKLSFDLRPVLYICEDATYTILVNGEWRGVQAGGEWNGLGIVNRDVQIPAGAFVIERRWFLGKVFISVYHNNGQEQIN